MNYKYILDEHGNAIEEPDLIKWATWFETADRHVAEDKIGDVRVSTVFRGIDHRFNSAGKPVLWETIIFGGPHDEYQDRYTSLGDAKKGHEVAVALAKSATVQ